jgi:hypothetical protein
LKAKLAVIVLAAAWFAAVSCSKTSPAGSWNTYRTDKIEDQFSDQGPWGGSRWIHWVARDMNTSTPADTISFATEHAWKCGEVVDCSAERMRAWKSISHRPDSPLFFGEPTATMRYLSPHEFPRHIEDDCFLIKCETG